MSYIKIEFVFSIETRREKENLKREPVVLDLKERNSFIFVLSFWFKSFILDVPVFEGFTRGQPKQ